MPYRTDLALESTLPHRGSLPAGVSEDEYEYGNLHIHSVKIDDDEAANLIGKAIGEYITITVPAFYSATEITEEEVTAIAQEIAAMLPEEGLVLVAGLGNSDITPDAVGPFTAHGILATRHISTELAAQSGIPELRPVAAIAPGVLGQTGIETSEIIRSVVNDVKPAAVIVIDALAARSTARLGNTIQIANCGISPGSGVMNRRKELSRATLGVPVVSVGIPTVVDAATLAGDLLSGGEELAAEQRALFEPEGQSMMITPREIDTLIDHACKTLALAINKALQPELTLEEIEYMAG